MNSYLSVIYHSDPFYFILPVNVCSTLSMMCVCVCVCVCVDHSQPTFIHSIVQSFIHYFIRSFTHLLCSNINMFQLPTNHFLFIVQVTYRSMGPGVEILYVKYLLNFHVYNTCHYNKKKLLTYLLTYTSTYNFKVWIFLSV